jgi:hypothetical protein
MYTGNLDTSGRIHDCRWIAEIASIETTKAGPFLTLPQYNLLTIVVLEAEYIPPTYQH